MATGVPSEPRPRASAGAALAALWLALPAAFGADVVAFDPTLPAGTCCTIDVRRLHPTQAALGLQEARLRTERLARLTPAKLDRYLREHVAPVAIGPGGVPYLLDHHHLARVLLDTGAAPALYADIRENWRELPEPEFWARMQARSWVYLRDEHGQGPLAPARLPASVADLRDDPYRSLAWAVRQRGGYRETPVPYADFQWADFFRTRVPAAAVRERFDAAVTAALALAGTAAARDLPGFVPSPAAPPKP